MKVKPEIDLRLLLASIFSLKRPLGRASYWICMCVLWVPGMILWAKSSISNLQPNGASSEASEFWFYVIVIGCILLGLWLFSRRIADIGFSLTTALLIYFSPMLFFIVVGAMQGISPMQLGHIVTFVVVFAFPIIWTVMMVLAGFFPHDLRGLEPSNERTHVK